MMAVVTGCTKADRKSGDSGSNFVVVSLDGTAKTGTIAAGVDWQVPSQVSVSFEACLVDTVTRAKLINQKFFVAIPQSAKGFDVISNNQGCINWTEDVPFNYYAGKSGWITMTRTLVGRGVNQGKQDLQILVNPWVVGDHARDSGPVVIYPPTGMKGVKEDQIFKEDATTMALSGESAGQGDAELIIKDAKIQASPIGEGLLSVKLRYTIDVEA
jgi:hypothetical protein